MFITLAKIVRLKRWNAREYKHTHTPRHVGGEKRYSCQLAGLLIWSSNLIYRNIQTDKLYL
jgi:hypothetical protein